MKVMADKETPAGKAVIALNFDGTHLTANLREAGEKLHGSQGEAILDLTAVRRVDVPALHALEEFARLAEEKSVKIALRGVNVEVYKALKLMKLTQRFSFVN